MNKGTLHSYYRRMLKRFAIQNGVPKKDIPAITKRIHEGLKAEFGVETTKIDKITRYDLWLYVSKCEMILIREYGYMVDDEKELKFNT